MADSKLLLKLKLAEALQVQEKPKERGGFLPAAGRVLAETGEGLAEPFEEPLGLSPELREKLITNAPPGIREFNQMVIGGGVAALDLLGRAVEAPIAGAARGGAQIARETGAGGGMARRLERDIRGIGQTALTLGAVAPIPVAPSVRSVSSPRTVRGAERATTRAAFERQGVTPTAGAVSGSRPIQSTESFLSSTPGGAGIMQRATEKTVGETAEAARGLAEKTGSTLSPQTVGGQLRIGATEAGKRFDARREVLDAGIEAAIGADTVVPVQNVEQLLESLRAEMGKAPKSRAELQAAITELENIMADAKGGVIPFGQLRKIRTRIGADLGRPDVTGLRPSAEAPMAQVYGALKDDITAAAEASGPTGKQALALHDRYVRMMREINLPVLEELTRLKTDEQVFNWALAQGKVGGSRIAALRRNLRDKYGEPIWDEVVSTVIARMGDARAGQQGVPAELLGQADTFSPNSFLTNFSKMSPEAKSALFGGTRYAELRGELEDLVRITDSLKDAEKMTNFSNTGRVALFGALSLSIGMMAGGNVRLGLGALAGTVVAPRVAAKLITSKPFLDWLTAGAKSLNNPKNLSRHILRLGAIANANPDIEDEITEYLGVLRTTLPPEMLQERPAELGESMIPRPPAGGFSSVPMGAL